MRSKFRSEGPRSRRIATPARDIQKRLLVVCGGKRTERDYFEALKEEHRNTAVTVRVRAEKRSPLHVVEKAVDLFESSQDSFDECWAVFDVDRFGSSGNQGGASNLTRSISMARKNGVRLAISNPCFEYWLLLHFCDHSAHLTDYKPVRDKIKHFLPNYDKADIRMADYSPGIREAISRAKKRDKNQQPPGSNPNTAVWRIVDQMLPKDSCPVDVDA